MDFQKSRIRPFLIIIGTFVLLFGAGWELYQVAWGTGEWLGEFSFKWFLLFAGFVTISIGLFLWNIFLLMNPTGYLVFSEKLVNGRKRLSISRWLFAMLILTYPIWFFHYSMWGIVFQGVYVRALVWLLDILFIAFLISNTQKMIDWIALLSSVIITGASFTIAVSLGSAVSYPFSMGWSEGNRLWDYSIMFGRELYDFPADQGIPVLLDPGRQMIGGLPFLIPGLTIGMERIWVGLTQVLPYLLVGLTAFSIHAKEKRIWFLAILWGFLFLRQGPIHPPLVLVAALTAFIWRKPLWLAFPLIIYAGNVAQASRFSWMFAPGIWIGVLELAGTPLQSGGLTTRQWGRAIALGSAGLFGGYLLPKIAPLFQRGVDDLGEVAGQIAQSGTNLDLVTKEVTHQPLLWYRLFPNSTYGYGILAGLLVAVAPLIIILLWLVLQKKWRMDTWQTLTVVGALLAFLVVGLIASTKIGGGGDLHNLDMFLLGLFFTAVLAWFNGGRQALLNPEQLPLWMKVVVVAALIIPSIGPWRQMRSFEYGDKSAVLVTLTDLADSKQLELLPSSEKVGAALAEIDSELSLARKSGDILFIDQRQLLTFGFVQKVPLIPEYEKKVLMNQAMSSDRSYFESFYKDLADHRFSLIISELLRTPIKDSSFQFGEENNAWVKWVSSPLLCYYEEKQTFNEVGVQLLVPKSGDVDCSAYLP